MTADDCLGSPPHSVNQRAVLVAKAFSVELGDEAREVRDLLVQGLNHLLCFVDRCPVVHARYRWFGQVCFTCTACFLFASMVCSDGFSAVVVVVVIFSKFETVSSSIK